MNELKCVAGCKHFTGGEIKHHKDCPYYPESFSKMYDDLEEKVKKLRLSAVSGQSELLIAFADWVFEQPKHLGGRERELVAEYLKVINSH